MQFLYLPQHWQDLRRHGSGRLYIRHRMQGQLTLGYLGGDNYTTSNGIAVRQGGIRSALGRIGFNLGKDIDEKTNIYLKANLLHEFGGGYHAAMTDSSGSRIKIDRSFNPT